MSLRIKNDVDLTRLKDFGFELWGEVKDRQEYAEYCYCFMDCWYLAFARDEDGNIITVEDDHALCHAWVDTRDGNNYLLFDAEPYGTYHVGMSDLDLVTDTVFLLTQAGLLERVND